jgi:protein TonB
MSELGSIAQCLLDSDSEALGPVRQLRRKALLASIVLEAAVLAAMLLWPLVTPGVLPPQFIFTPAPPIHGAPNSTPARPPAGTHTAPGPPAASPTPVYQPPTIPPHAANASDSEPPSVGNQFTEAGLQTGIAAGNDDGAATPLVPPNDAAQKRPPLKRSEGIMQALLVRRVQPEYPPIALVMRLSGTVRLHAVIGTDGRVRELAVLGGNPILAQSALAAVRQWRYQPTLLSGEAVEVETYITVEFVLR